MKQVERIDKKESEKPIEITEVLNPSTGWGRVSIDLNDYDRVVYLGKCFVDGDMFAAYHNNRIEIFRGHLNSGKY